MHALRYAFDEAIRSLWRGRQSGLLSTATIALALVVLGSFLLVTANLERLVGMVQRCHRDIPRPNNARWRTFWHRATSWPRISTSPRRTP